MNFLESHSFKSSLSVNINKDTIRCLACQRRCVIPVNREGYCRVRFNRNGYLIVPYGYVSSMNIDPVEKKPVYHFMPGSMTLSFGMIGCNFKCLYCQNFEISQKIFDDSSGEINLIEISSDSIVDIAVDNNIKVLVSTYNEPAISIEWACEVFKKAKQRIKGAKAGIVSNGYLSEKSLDYIKDYVDFIRVDLKSFNHDKFKKLTDADLNLLLNSIREIYKKGFHLEIVTLVVNGFNDSLKEIEEMAFFIKSLSPDIPWHLTRFHPEYKMNNLDYTDTQKIEDLIKFARSSGVNYVYGGNFETSYSDTCCPKCSKKIFERGYMSLKFSNILNGRCPYCGFKIYGVYE